MNKIPRSQIKDAKILIAEDNDFYRGVIVHHLDTSGFHNVTEVIDGLGVLNNVHQEDFDLILLDIEMPNMDGYQVLEQLKSDDKFRGIPIIVLSAIEEMDSVVKCIELGAEDYLPKPVNVTILRARLNACLEKKYLHDQEKFHLNQIEAEKQKVDNLIKIILPKAAAEELKEKGFVLPRRFENVAILFCDIIGFTRYCDHLPPEKIVVQITSLIECFEQLTASYQMEKIKTIGDEFMATAGLLLPNENPLEAAARCGLAMSEAAPKLEAGWQVRIGIAQGPVVAGIVGNEKYQYDLWGDTVNISSRMTSYGKPGVVVMPKHTSEMLGDEFDIESMGIIDVKGKGNIEVVECKLKT